MDSCAAAWSRAGTFYRRRATHKVHSSPFAPGVGPVGLSTLMSRNLVCAVGTRARYGCFRVNVECTSERLSTGPDFCCQVVQSSERETRFVCNLLSTDRVHLAPFASEQTDNVTEGTQTDEHRTRPLAANACPVQL